MDPRTTWPALLNALLGGQSLSAEETAWAMNEIMSGQATDVQIAGFAVALRAKGESVAEVIGARRGHARARHTARRHRPLRRPRRHRR